MDIREKSLLEAVEHPVFAIEPDATGQPVFAAANACARRIGNWREDEILGLSALEVLPGRPGRVSYEHHRQGLRTGTRQGFDLLSSFGGAQRLVRTTLTPVRDDTGQVRCLIGSWTELGVEGVASGRTEMEEFIALAAHDLRAPMRHVMTIARLMREDDMDAREDRRDLIDMLETLGATTMGLIGEILALAQSRAVPAGPFVDFDLRTLVTDLLAMLDPMGRCRIDCAPVRLCTDRTVLQMVLGNLVDNAIKHAGRADLGISFAVAPDGEGRLSFCVRDNGGGFAAPALLFLRGGPLKTGSGFGLLAVRRLIRARGGTITARNHPAGSAEVSFTLPGRLSGLPVRSEVRRVPPEVVPLRASS